MNICSTGEVTALEGEITSPNFPNDYPPNMSCELTINVGPGNTIVIKFPEFDLEDDEDGEYSHDSGFSLVVLNILVYITRK